MPRLTRAVPVAGEPADCGVLGSVDTGPHSVKDAELCITEETLRDQATARANGQAVDRSGRARAADRCPCRMPGRPTVRLGRRAGPFSGSVLRPGDRYVPRSDAGPGTFPARTPGPVRSPAQVPGRSARATGGRRPSRRRAGTERARPAGRAGRYGAGAARGRRVRRRCGSAGPSARGVRRRPVRWPPPRRRGPPSPLPPGPVRRRPRAGLRSVRSRPPPGGPPRPAGGVRGLVQDDRGGRVQDAGGGELLGDRGAAQELGVEGGARARRSGSAGGRAGRRSS